MASDSRRVETAVIIVAGGNGSRMAAAMGSSSLPKQFLELDGVPVLVRTVRRFQEALPGAPIVLVLPAAHMPVWGEMSAHWSVVNVDVCQGGDSRFESVKNGLAAIQGCDWVVVHDGVRPLVSCDLICRVLSAAHDSGAAIPVVDPVDSLREITADGSRAVDRSRFRAVQTPQVFKKEILKQAYNQPCNPAFTDDATVVESLGVKVTLCAGERSNIKITTPEDMAVAESLLHQNIAR